MESRRSLIIQVWMVAGFRYRAVLYNLGWSPDPFFLDEAIGPRRVDVSV